jgi:hypothetical protein
MMIRRCRELEQYEKQRIAAAKPDYQRNLLIFQDMYDYACAMGALPPADRLAGLEVDIHLAKVLNAQLAKPHYPPR